MEISIGLEGSEAPALLTALTVTVRYRLQMSTLSSSVQNTVMFMVIFRFSGWYAVEKMVAFSPAEVSRSTRKCVGNLMLPGRLTWSGRLILVTCRDGKKKQHTHTYVLLVLAMTTGKLIVNTNNILILCILCIAK